MAKRQANGAPKAAPRPRSGAHTTDRRKVPAPRKAAELWDRAAARAGDKHWTDWAVHALTIQAADELGIDPLEALKLIDN